MKFNNYALSDWQSNEFHWFRTIRENDKFYIVGWLALKKNSNNNFVLDCMLSQYSPNYNALKYLFKKEFIGVAEIESAIKAADVHIERIAKITSIL